MTYEIDKDGIAIIVYDQNHNLSQWTVQVPSIKSYECGVRCLKLWHYLRSTCKGNYVLLRHGHIFADNN